MIWTIFYLAHGKLRQIRSPWPKFDYALTDTREILDDMIGNGKYEIVHAEPVRQK